MKHKARKGQQRGKDKHRSGKVYVGSYLQDHGKWMGNRRTVRLFSFFDFQPCSLVFGFLVGPESEESARTSGGIQLCNQGAAAKGRVPSERKRDEWNHGHETTLPCLSSEKSRALASGFGWQRRHCGTYQTVSMWLPYLRDINCKGHFTIIHMFSILQL